MRLNYLVWVYIWTHEIWKRRSIKLRYLCTIPTHRYLYRGSGKRILMDDFKGWYVARNENYIPLRTLSTFIFANVYRYVSQIWSVSHSPALKSLHPTQPTCVSLYGERQSAYATATRITITVHLFNTAIMPNSIAKNAKATFLRNFLVVWTRRVQSFLSIVISSYFKSCDSRYWRP